MSWIDEIEYRLRNPRCLTPAGIVLLIVLGVALLLGAFFLTSGRPLR